MFERGEVVLEGDEFMTKVLLFSFDGLFFILELLFLCEKQFVFLDDRTSLDLIYVESYDIISDKQYDDEDEEDASGDDDVDECWSLSEFVRIVDGSERDVFLFGRF